ncbi:MAG: hypothetical protein Q9227_008127 [Pyrenula ochraceoflavens]
MGPTNGDVAQVLDFTLYPTARLLVDRCREFFAEVEDLTPGKGLEERLNKDYGPGNPYYEDFCKYVKQGLKEGWVAQTGISDTQNSSLLRWRLTSVAELDGPKYRRGKIALPSAENRYFSITTVYMSSDQEYSGQYHAHPYGEINCVVQMDDTAELKGMSGWQGAGWTSPGPGTHHYPQVRKGGLCHDVQKAFREGFTDLQIDVHVAVRV